MDRQQQQALMTRASSTASPVITAPSSGTFHTAYERVSLRLFYDEIHKDRDHPRGINGPIFSRGAVGGGNAGGPLLRATPSGISQYQTLRRAQTASDGMTRPNTAPVEMRKLAAMRK